MGGFGGSGWTCDDGGKYLPYIFRHDPVAGEGGMDAIGLVELGDSADIL